jgi:hypothetical protein
MNPVQNAPLTRSPRGDDGDGGDGADSSAWVEDKKQGAAMSSEATGSSGSESLPSLGNAATGCGRRRMNINTLLGEKIFIGDVVSH